MNLIWRAYFNFTLLYSTIIKFFHLSINLLLYPQTFFTITMVDSMNLLYMCDSIFLFTSIFNYLSVLPSITIDLSLYPQTFFFIIAIDHGRLNESTLHAYFNFLLYINLSLSLYPSIYPSIHKPSSSSSSSPLIMVDSSDPLCSSSWGRGIMTGGGTGRGWLSWVLLISSSIRSWMLFSERGGLEAWLTELRLEWLCSPGLEFGIVWNTKKGRSHVKS